ncbi:MAG: DUF2130 domain-containing protein [Gammaproteobacteria bacterium]|nr:DUF2130 domain-containing protein [Gammaproteobacteria bacterium]
MHEITCPHCQKAFKIDEAGYADILKQVHNSEFEQKLHERLELAEKDKINAVKLVKVEADGEIQKAGVAKDTEIQGLKAKLDAAEVTQQLTVTNALKSVEKERDELTYKLDQAKLEKQVAETSLKDKYQTQIKDRDAEIERLRDMKARLSTKMVGETLEQHCETGFNLIRATAFPDAYFEKDNDAKTGSKGDYIFRDSDQSDIEVVSYPLQINLQSQFFMPMIFRKYKKNR